MVPIHHLYLHSMQIDVFLIGSQELDPASTDNTDPALSVSASETSSSSGKDVQEEVITLQVWDPYLFDLLIYQLIFTAEWFLKLFCRYM